MAAPDCELDELRNAAGDFVDQLVLRLEADSVLPRPRFAQPFIDIGRDFFLEGSESSALRRFEYELQRSFPTLFGQDEPAIDYVPLPHFAYSFGSLCIARASMANESPGSSAPSFGECFDVLVAEARAPKTRHLACRFVWNVGCDTPLDIGGVALLPAEDAEDAARIIFERLPKARSSVPVGELNFGFGAPASVLVAGVDSDAYVLDTEAERLEATALVDRLLLSIRLRSAATVWDDFEVVGMTHQISGYTPLYRQAQSGAFLRRTATLSVQDVEAIERLSRALDLIRRPAEGLVIDPLVVAINKFTLSFRAGPWWDHVVDLVTGMEAVLSGVSRTDVTLRIKSRAAVLLATQDDPAEQVFDDLGVFYAMRSTLVHGSPLKSEKLRSQLIGLLDLSSDTPLNNLLIDQAVDRLRDLLRRAILARVALSSAQVGLWPSNRSADGKIDRLVVSDAARHNWRDAWHQHWADLGLDGVWEKPEDGRSYLSTAPGGS